MARAIGPDYLHRQAIGGRSSPDIPLLSEGRSSERRPCSGGACAVGGTGADVESWTRRAFATARRANRDLLLQDLFDEIGGGRRPLPRELRRAVALHESGHLIVGLALRLFDPHSLRLASDGGRATADAKIENMQTTADIENFITMLMAGRAAEEEFLTEAGATVGAGGDEESDLAKATRAACAIELKLGLGSFGPVYFEDRAAESMMRDKTFMDAIRSRLERCRARARRLVALNRDIVEIVAGSLDEIGHLDRRELLRLTGGVSFIIDRASEGKMEEKLAESDG